MPTQQSSSNDHLTFRVDLNSAEVVSNYDELPLWSAAFGLLLLEHVPLRQNINVLDVGCGTGFPLLELAQRLGPSCTVVGLDTWEAALERARFKARVSGVRNVEITKGDAAAMSFPDAQFDLVVSNLGLNNFRDPEAAVAECRRVMKPTAQLVLTTNLQGHMKEFYDVFESTLRSLGETDAIEALNKHIDHRTTVERTRALLERNGLRITKVHEASASMRFADGSSLLRQYSIKLGFLGAWKGVVNPRRLEEIFCRLESNLNQWAESRGGLALTIPMAYVEAEKPG
jgi:ubiquinone/menaquinone biosynthesis C-methylase UbiE